MWDDLYARERDTALAMAASRPPEAPESPGFWANAHKAVGLGIMEGGAKAGQALMLAGSAVPRLVDTFAGGDNLTGETLTERYFDALGEPMQRAIDHWSLPYESVGTAGRVLYGVGQIALPLMAGAGNPALLMATQGFGTAADLVRQGVDADTAGAAGTVSAFTTGVGMMLPMAGRTLAQSLAIGAGGNVATGMFDRVALKAILQHADYGKIAAQYKVFDPEQMAAEALIGSVFGAVAHAVKPPDANAPALTPDEHAAALTLNAAATRDADTLVKPGDVNGMTAAHDAQAVAAAQLDRGEPVSVAHMLTALDDAKVAEVRAKVEKAVAKQAEEVKPAPAAESGPDPWSEPQAARTFDQRISDENIRAELLRMKGETGWAEEGGRLLRSEGMEGDVIGRSAWVPNAEWWPGRPKGLKETEVRKAVDKALAGEKLKAAERRIVEYMADVAEQRLKSNAFKLFEDELAKFDLDAHNELDVAMTARAAEINPDAVESLAMRFESDDAGFMRGIKELLDEHDSKNTGSGKVSAGSKEPADRAAGTNSQEIARTGATPEITAASDMLARNPDMIVRTADGRDVRAADFMREMDAEFSRDTADASAFEAAANCFLQTGSAP